MILGKEFRRQPQRSGRVKGPSLLARTRASMDLHIEPPPGFCVDASTPSKGPRKAYEEPGSGCSLSTFGCLTPGGKVAPAGIDRTARLAVGVKIFPNSIIFLGRLGLPTSATDLGLLSLPAGPASHVDG